MWGAADRVAVGGNAVYEWPSGGRDKVYRCRGSGLVVGTGGGRVTVVRVSAGTEAGTLGARYLSLPVCTSNFSKPSCFILSFQLFMSFFVSDLLLV